MSFIQTHSLKFALRRSLVEGRMYNGMYFTDLYNRPFLNACSEQTPICDQPRSIKISLRAHQRAIIHSMIGLENNLRKGYDISGEKLYSRFAVLGDSVGVGKSLMVLGHIAAMKGKAPLSSYRGLNQYSNKNVFSFVEHSYTDLSNSPALLVVPHTLFRQWKTYIDDQTDLTCYAVTTKRAFESTLFFKKLVESDVVLISNTLVGKMLELIEHKIYFSRIYVDEADSIYIPSTQRFPDVSFLWLISATWQNLLFENERIWLPHTHVQRVTQRPDFTQLDPVYQAYMLQSVNAGRGFVARYTSRSGLYFREFLRIQHPFRTQLVLRCRDEFIQNSISLPPLFTRTIECEPSMAQRIVSSSVPHTIQNLLNAGDVQSALSALGVPADSPMNLIQAVTENRTNELHRLERLYIFKQGEEYSTPQAKEQALANLQSKISSLKEQITSIKKRIENYKKEICAICYDEPTKPLLTPCCSAIFCAVCILECLSRKNGCPLCRTEMPASQLHEVSEGTQAPIQTRALPAKKPKKLEALVELLRKNPRDKFLVFSRYENPFRMMQETLETDNITVQSVKGNKDVISSLLERFDAGSVRVLLLNSNHAGAGLNITSATYVVLWHAMTPEEEKQILGRAYRMGRTTPLHFVKLVHPNEVAS